MDMKKCSTCIRFSEYKGKPTDTKGNVLGWCQQLSLKTNTNSYCKLWVEKITPKTEDK